MSSAVPGQEHSHTRPTPAPPADPGPVGEEDGRCQAHSHNEGEGIFLSKCDIRVESRWGQEGSCVCLTELGGPVGSEGENIPWAQVQLRCCPGQASTGWPSWGPLQPRLWPLPIGVLRTLPCMTQGKGCSPVQRCCHPSRGESVGQGGVTLGAAVWAGHQQRVLEGEEVPRPLAGTWLV